jgi:hypothetical protein
MEEENSLVERAYKDLFPESEAEYAFSIVYTGRLKPYGANVSIRPGSMQFKLSRKWYGVSPEIQMGIIQELMLKILKKKKNTMYIDLYNNFVKSLHLAIPKDLNEPQLEASFNRINERYFLGLVERPNLKWGQESTRTFGSYDFKTDTIKISTIFKDTEDKYLDYIMYHETLHKQRKFFKSGTKTYYHDARFKRLEAIFENGEQIEKELGLVARKARTKAVAAKTIQRIKRPRFWDWF